jgi:hypothetical protein
MFGDSFSSIHYQKIVSTYIPHTLVMGVGCENFLKVMNIKGPLPMYVGKFCLSIIFITNKWNTSINFF